MNWRHGARPLSRPRGARPEPGLLAQFPAYIWHGVEPFVSEEPRLTVAFDVLPAWPGTSKRGWRYWRFTLDISA